MKPKYYYWDNNQQMYHIMKKKNGKMVNFGYYPSEDVAKFIVKELVKCNWQKSYLPNILKKVFKQMENKQ